MRTYLRRGLAPAQDGAAVPRVGDKERGVQQEDVEAAGADGGLFRVLVDWYCIEGG